MIKQYRNIVLLLLASVVAFGNLQFTAKKHAGKPRKVIFMIGDGMGLTQITGAMAGYKGVNAFERFKVIGLSKTSSADNYVTDSGAGATAFSIGKKTNNYAIGVDADSIAQPTLFELAKKKNMSTGVVVTSSVVHATPASFYAHAKKRSSYEDIAAFLLAGNCDIAIGGGTDFFSNRKDKKDLLKELRDMGFQTYTDSILNTSIASSRFIYLLAKDGMPKMQEGRGGYLLAASSLAIKNLSSNKNGYMLMIEGSQIDWGGHDNDFAYMRAELIDFNEVINMVLDQAAKDGETLVVVTADHETGGLTLTENKKDRSTFDPKYTYGHHTGVMVPVFAFGPGAEQFGGMYENTAIFDKMVNLLNLR